MAAWGPIARLIVGGLLGPAAPALYRVAASLADSAQKPADLLAKAFYPEVVRMDLSDQAAVEADAARRLRWRARSRWSRSLLLMVGGKPLVELLFGDEFLGAYPVLLVLIGVPLLGIVSFPLPPMLYALDRPDAPLKARIAGTLVYFACRAVVLELRDHRRRGRLRARQCDDGRWS